MKSEKDKRLEWVKLYEQTKNAEQVCLKCGISRPTLRKWVRRYASDGEAGLVSKSRKPHTSPKRKILTEQEQWIVELRQRRLGARRIRNELIRWHDYRLSMATIHKILTKHGVEPLQVSRKPRHTVTRYSRPIPGDRVQMDTCQIGPNLYQYTAVDDCTRWRVLALYSERTAENSLDFLDFLINEMPFNIQRIQTDRGQEFFAYKFQERLQQYAIKFRPIKPRSPHLNGKVERSQKTDWEEFYSLQDLADPKLKEKLAQWQDYYNCERPHGSLNNQTPDERRFDLITQVPFSDEIGSWYDRKKERIRAQHYKSDQKLAELELAQTQAAVPTKPVTKSKRKLAKAPKPEPTPPPS